MSPRPSSTMNVSPYFKTRGGDAGRDAVMVNGASAAVSSMNVTPWACSATSAAVFNDIVLAFLAFRFFDVTQRIAAQGLEGHRNENAVALRRTRGGPDCSICFCCAAPKV